MYEFVHISDFHLNGYRNQQLSCELGLPERAFCDLFNRVAERTLEHIAGAYPRLDFLLFTGDLVGNPPVDAHDSIERILAALRRLTDAGAALVFCEGSHDKRDPRALRAIRGLCTAYFRGDGPYRQKRIKNVNVFGVGNCSSSADRGRVVSSLRTKGSRIPCNLVLAHRREDIKAGCIRFRESVSYFGHGHQHRANVPLDPRALVCPGSVSCYVLSQYLRYRRVKGRSVTMTQVREAGYVHGILEQDGRLQRRFWRATCSPVEGIQQTADSLHFECLEQPPRAVRK
jgi:3',5'-cyclic AMP phosphodiesterase CpdA